MPTEGHSLNLKLIFLCAGLECIGWSCITPVLPELQIKMGFSSSQVSFVAALTGLVSLFSAGFQGKLSDHFSKISLLKLSTTAQMLSQAVLGLFALGVLESWTIFITMRVIGAGLKMGMIVSQAYVVDYSYATDPSSSEQRTTGFISTLMSCSNVGFLLGPVIGGFLARNPSYPFFFSIVVFSLNLLALYLIKDTTPQQQYKGGLASIAELSSPYSKQAGRGRGHLSSIDCEDGGGADYSLDAAGAGATGDGNNGSGRADLAAMSSIGLRKHRRPSRDYDEGYHHHDNMNRRSLSPASHYNSSGSSGSSTHNNKSRGAMYDGDSNDKTRRRGGEPSLFYLLHVKFAFQISNTIYESLFAQHLQQRLKASAETLGWMLSAVGLQAAVVNAFVVPFLIAQEGKSNWYWLVLCSVIQTVGTVLWALALSIRSAFFGSVCIGFSSNVFLSILQGMLGRFPAQARQQQQGSGSGSGGAKGGVDASKTSSGMTYGLSTVMDRGARALAPLIAAASMSVHLHVPAALYHLIGSLGTNTIDGTLTVLSPEEAEAISVVHANEVLGLALVCILSGLYTITLLGGFHCNCNGVASMFGKVMGQGHNGKGSPRGRLMSAGNYPSSP
jgi:predicted MFS family arabinose efflux permease